MQGKSITPSVIEWLNAHVGQTFTLRQISTEIGEEERSVQNVIWKLNKDHASAFTVITRGQAWIWHGIRAHEKQTPRLFEYLTETKSGRVIVQDEDGSLYILTEME